MGMNWDDVSYEMAMEALHQEAIMERAAREQSIYLFVEGRSEEIAIPILFQDVIDLDALGIKIANYNGRGNLHAALRLLKLTLDHDRPVILTYDNDPESISSVQFCKDQRRNTDLVYQFPIPIEPVVTYQRGYQGGSIEESFSAEVFINAAFSGYILPSSITSQRECFESIFDLHKPWFLQLKKFTS